VKSELILKLIQIVKYDINLDEMREVSNYIAKSICNHFIHISKKNKSKQTSELDEDSEPTLDLCLSERSVSNINISDFVTFEFLKLVLTAKEYDCVYKNVFMGYTVEEISDIYISRGRRAIKEIRRLSLKSAGITRAT